MKADQQERLQAYCVQNFPNRADLQIKNLRDITTGWESEIYAFDVESGTANARQQEKLILRLFPGLNASGKAAHEFASMKQLHQVGYPVPQVFALATTDSPLGRPLILMERIEGSVLLTRLEQATPEQQPALFGLYCRLFVQLHTLDWRRFVGETDQQAYTEPYVFIDRWLKTAYNRLQEYPLAGFQAALAWLAQRRDSLACVQPAPVHQDFHPNNVLLRADDSPVVIDWTGFAISDARFDLAWALLLAYAHIDGGLRDLILHGYEAMRGEAVRQIECFEVIACLRRLFDLLVSLGSGAEQQGMRPETVALMKAQMVAYQRVYGLLVAHTGVHIAEIEQILKD
jgi:aminoglycoside phosphotransferase (APT) family kinase protein